VTRVCAAAAMLLATLGAVPRDLPFVFWFSSRGVDVEIARPPDGPPWLRSRGEIPVAASRVAAVLSDFTHYRELFSPAVRKADVVERDRSSVRIHFVWPYPFPYANRDAVARRLRRLPDDVHVPGRPRRQEAWREESVQYFRAIRRELGLPEVPN
jgi:hypothetical protein